MKKSKLAFLFLATLVFSPVLHSFAQETDKLLSLSKQIIEAKFSQDLYAPFAELKDIYFKENKYGQFVEFLKSLGSQKKSLEPFVNYYTALSRYQQLKYLEEKQAWDEYFSQGNNYREELTQAAKSVVSATQPKEPLNIYARLLLWQFHKDQQDVFTESALSDLMNSVLEYAKEASDLEPIKQSADKLLAYGEKGKSKELYKIYAQKIATSQIKLEELQNIAANFYKEGNLELAESIYDIFIERSLKVTPKEKLLPVLIAIAKDFSYKDSGAFDMHYAQTIYQKIESLGDKEVFDEELMYLAGFNLEKAREYAEAKDVYLDFIKHYPKSSQIDEVVFKIGIIYTYILRDEITGADFFQQLAQKEKVSPQVVSGLYQLGLLNQWKGELEKAKEYYDKLLAASQNNFSETVTLAKDRLKEIEQGKPLEYNLRTFLDLSLKPENKQYNTEKIDLKAHPYKAKQQEPINISSSTYVGESGCLQPELQYLWSGDLGSNKPIFDQAGFALTYKDKGTKVINLVVVSPSGIIDRTLDLVDVD